MSDRAEKVIKIVLIGGIVISVLVIVLIYGPVLLLGIQYRLNREEYAQSNEILTTEYINDTEETIPDEISGDVEFLKTMNAEGRFGIVIPAIGVRAFVAENIDPYNEAEYMAALHDSVAHAEGTKLPGEGGKIFIFAHSAMNFYQMATQNIDFYLINDLEIDDKIVLSHGGESYMYRVIGSKFVSPNKIDELESPSDSEVLLLMTCWPPGVDLKRLIVTAELVP